MSWNYRVIKKQFSHDDEFFAIHEVYYDNDDETKPSGLTKEPIPLVADSLNDLQVTLTRIQSALSKPVLNYEDF